MKNYLIIVLCFAILKGIAQPAVNDTVPDFSIVDVNGNTHQLYSYLEEGKYVCIDFFGTTCAQCKDIVPILSQTYKSYGCNQSKLVILAIDLLHYDGEVQAFEEEYGGIYPAISGKNGGGDQVYNDWGIQYWPQLVLINPDKVMVSNISPISHLAIDSVLLSHQILKDSCSTNGLDEQFLQQEKISAFPNPTSGILNVELNNFPKSDLKYHLYNSMGSIVLSNPCSNSFSMDLSMFDCGVYFIEIINNGVSYRKKIIIN